MSAGQYDGRDGNGYQPIAPPGRSIPVPPPGCESIHASGSVAFKDEDALIEFLDNLHSSEGTAVTNQKWAPAQRAIGGIRGTAVPDGYVAIAIPGLKALGVYDRIQDLLVYPLDKAPKPEPTVELLEAMSNAFDSEPSRDDPMPHYLQRMRQVFRTLDINPAFLVGGVPSRKPAREEPLEVSAPKADLSNLDALIETCVAQLNAKPGDTLQEVRAFLSAVHSTDNLNTARDKLERAVELLRRAEFELITAATAEGGAP